MAKSQSEFLRSMGGKLDEIHKRQMGRKTEYGNAQLPAGIENGVAQLKEIKLGKFKEGPNVGKFFWMAMATVKKPLEHDGVKCVSLTTSIGPEPLCETPDSQGKRKTLEDHYAWVLNQMRLLLGQKEQTWGIDELEDYITLLNKKKPHLLFRTWKGQKQMTGPYAGKEPKVNHEWLGMVKYEEKIDHAAAVEESPRNGQENGQDNGAFNEFEGQGGEDNGDETPNSEGFDYSEATLDQLEQVVDGCKEKQDEAYEALYRLGKQVGVSKDAIDETDTWDQAKELIEQASSMPTEEEKPKQRLTVKVGNVYSYRPFDKKKKAPAEKPVKVEVTALDKKAGVCTLKSLVSKAEYEGVKIDDLLP